MEVVNYFLSNQGLFIDQKHVSGERLVPSVVSLFSHSLDLGSSSGWTWNG